MAREFRGAGSSVSKEQLVGSAAAQARAFVDEPEGANVLQSLSGLLGRMFPTDVPLGRSDKIIRVELALGKNRDGSTTVHHASFETMRPGAVAEHDQSPLEVGPSRFRHVCGGR